MTAPRDYGDFLNDIVDACRSLIDFVAGMTLEQYLADRKTSFAVRHGFEMMGEAARPVPETIKSENTDIPWQSMAAMRNRVIHGYFGVDDSILFTTIQNELKPLLSRLEKLAQSSGDSE